MEEKTYRKEMLCVFRRVCITVNMSNMTSFLWSPWFYVFLLFSFFFSKKKHSNIICHKSGHISIPLGLFKSDLKKRACQFYSSLKSELSSVFWVLIHRTYSKISQRFYGLLQCCTTSRYFSLSYAAWSRKNHSSRWWN